MLPKRRQWMGSLLTVLAMVGLGGCAGSYDVKVVLDQSSWQQAYGDVLPSLEVDLVGINESENPTWESYPVSKYFSPGDPLRRDADRYTVHFTKDDRSPKTLESGHYVWEKWVSGSTAKGAKWLYVIANIPGASPVSGPDPRRTIVPLDTKSWPMGTKELEIVLKSSMVVCTTPLKAK